MQQVEDTFVTSPKIKITLLESLVDQTHDKREDIKCLVMGTENKGGKGPEKEQSSLY